MYTFRPNECYISRPPAGTISTGVDEVSPCMQRTFMSVGIGQLTQTTYVWDLKCFEVAK